jgi:uncharacterized membrane protein
MSAPRRWLAACGVAALTGARTTLGPALLSWRRARRRPLGAAVYLMALVELIGDKLPRTPNRTAPLGLGLRIASAAGVARALVRARGPAVTAAALALGAAGAVAGAFAGLRLRLALTRRLGGGALANAIAGAIEDGAVIAIARRLVPPARPA